MARMRQNMKNCMNTGEKKKANWRRFQGKFAANESALSRKYSQSPTFHHWNKMRVEYVIRAEIRKYFNFIFSPIFICFTLSLHLSLSSILLILSRLCLRRFIRFTSKADYLFFLWFHSIFICSSRTSTTQNPIASDCDARSAWLEHIHLQHELSRPNKLRFYLFFGSNSINVFFKYGSSSARLFVCACSLVLLFYYTQNNLLASITQYSHALSWKQLNSSEFNWTLAGCWLKII